MFRILIVKMYSSGKMVDCADMNEMYNACIPIVRNISSIRFMPSLSFAPFSKATDGLDNQYYHYLEDREY